MCSCYCNRLATVLILFAMASPALAVQTVYTDEATYLSDLATLGYVSATEDFEDDNFWGLLEPTATTTVPGVTSQRIEWIGLGGGVNLKSSEARTGDWGLITSPVHSPFDGFLATAEQPLFGVGGWLRSSNAGAGGQNDISAFLNGSTVAADIFQVPTTPYTFWGVIDTAGITSLQFETEPVEPPEPGSGDPIDPSKTISLDDFTFGFATAPTLRELGTDWSNAAGGTYTTGDNWNGGAVPAVSDNALFHLGSAASYTVNFSQNETASQAVIGNDKVAFDLGGFQYNLTEPNITRESLIVSERPGDVGELTITNGTIAGANVVVAHSTTSMGHMTVGTGAAVNLTGAMRVGSGGNGTLDIHNGGTLTSGTGNFIGQLGGNGIVNVDGASTAWTLSGFGGTITVGSGGGTGTLNITAGATVTAGSIVGGKLTDNGLSSNTTGSGAINVSGTGTTLNAGSITLAQDANGAPSSMNISGGALVVGASGLIAISSDADVVLDGPGSSWTMNIGGSSRGTLHVGLGDQNGTFASFPPPPLHTGTLTIQNGASVQAEQTFIGRTRTGRGVLTVTGVGSLWSSGSQFSGNTFIGHDGDGELNVLAGGSVQTGQAFIGRLGLRDQLRGVANVDGAGSNWTTPSTIWVGFNNDPLVYIGAGLFFAEGVLNVTNAGSVNAGQLSLAGRKVSKGVVNITGTGSVVAANSVTFGKTFTSTFTFGSNAEMNISAGGLLDVTGNMDIHHGILTLNGGTVNAANLQLHGENLIEPGSPSETGDTRVTLTGTGQINANVLNSGGFISPGLSAGVLDINGDLTQLFDGTLDIELGGLLQGTEHDLFNVSGIANLGGMLDVSLIDPGTGLFAPALGDSFDILTAAGGVSGKFAGLNFPALGGGLGWGVTYGPNTVSVRVLTVALSPDFDFDGDVDGADLAVWEASYAAGAGADANGDFNSDGFDFLAWQRQLTGPGPPVSVAVPEPNSKWTFLSGLVILLLFKGGRLESPVARFSCFV